MADNKKQERIRNLKPFINGYAKADHGKRVLNRQAGHVPTGKTEKAEFIRIKESGAIKREVKDVRVMRWQNPVLGQALLKAAQGA